MGAKLRDESVQSEQKMAKNTGWKLNANRNTT